MKMNGKTKRIKRSFYLERLLKLKDTPDIKVITGVRRSGKSHLMRSYIDFLKENGEEVNTIYVDLMNFDFEELKEYHALHEYVEERYAEGVKNYVFIDEVQLCSKFELAINSLHSKEKYDIYITGSNAFLLGSDLATLFTGRYMELHVFPFSFKEYSQYNSNISDRDALFEKYCIEGGFAGSYIYETEQDKQEYIREVFETIVNRDLVQKYNITEVQTMRQLCDFLMDNISNLSSPNKITEVLKANNIQTNHVTIGKYIDYLCNAFVFYNIKRYDIQGKKYLGSVNKYYLSDVGMRGAILGTRNMDYGRIYENLVCLELMRRGYEVYVGKMYQKEVDFVAKKSDELIYIQVSDNISDEKTFEREYSPLLSIKNAYPKMILAKTGHPEYSYEGIRIVDIREWLMQ